jgi:putative copper resistance protein D
LLLLAVWAFDRLVLPSVVSLASQEIRERWQILETRWTLLLLPLIAISGAAWFVVLCVNMSGLSLRDAMQPDTIRVVWNQTQFGRLWQLRSILWLGTFYMPVGLSLRMPRLFRNFSAWINLILAGSLVSTLAWAGHGQDGGSWHLLADAVHLFTAGLWPMGLVPFAILLFQLRKLPLPQRTQSIAALTVRFSMLSLCSVAMLMISGFINAFFMVASVADLVRTNYGKLLLFKVSLFLSMLCFGAMNLLRLKPRLTIPTAGSGADVSAAKLQQNVISEIALGVVVLVVTAILGLLAPGPA